MWGFERGRPGGGSCRRRENRVPAARCGLPRSHRVAAGVDHSVLRQRELEVARGQVNGQTELDAQGNDLDQARTGDLRAVVVEAVVLAGELDGARRRIVGEVVSVTSSVRLNSSSLPARSSMSVVPR